MPGKKGGSDEAGVGFEHLRESGSPALGILFLLLKLLNPSPIAKTTAVLGASWATPVARTGGLEGRAVDTDWKESRSWD